MIFPGNVNGKTKIYEDDGNSVEYENNEFCWINITYSQVIFFNCVNN